MCVDVVILSHINHALNLRLCMDR